MPMNPRYRHGPVLDTQRKRCPVCHQSVYSLAGIHPQCAIKLADGIPPGIASPGDAIIEPAVAVSASGKVIPIKIPPVGP
jgi:hypothetical protein